jgi:flagellar secretion chaperone FliS
MWNSGHDAYLESRVLTANPVELVHMLYQGCIQAVREARYHLEAGRIADRCREINKACAILIELGASLDFERGGEVSRRLAPLYDYMQRRLVEANFQQADAPLAEVLELMTTLGEGWSAIREQAVKVEPQNAQPESGWTQSPSQPAGAEAGWTQSTETASAASNAWNQSAEMPWNRPATESPAAPGTANPWMQPVETQWNQPVAQQTQPVATDNPWVQAADQPFSQPMTPEPPVSAPNPWLQASEAWSSAIPGEKPAEPPARNPWESSPPEGAWSQPPLAESDYRIRAFSF